MSHFRIDSIGFDSSKMQSTNEQDVMSSYGDSWRFATDDVKKKVEEPAKTHPNMKTPDQTDPGEKDDADQMLEQAAMASKEELEKMPHEKLKQLASAIGIAKVEVSKPKLIDAILEKQAF